MTLGLKFICSIITYKQTSIFIIANIHLKVVKKDYCDELVNC